MLTKRVQTFSTNNSIKHGKSVYSKFHVAQRERGPIHLAAVFLQQID